MSNIDVNKIVVSNKVSFDKKKVLNISLVTKMLKIRPLCIFPPEKRAYRKDFDEIKYISFLMKNDETF